MARRILDIPEKEQVRLSQHQGLKPQRDVLPSLVRAWELCQLPCASPTAQGSPSSSETGMNELFLSPRGWAGARGQVAEWGRSEVCTLSGPPRGRAGARAFITS